MGWDYCSRWTTARILREDLNAQRASGVTIVAQKSTSHGRNLWTVYEDAAGLRFINLDLIGRSRGCYGYKAISEDMGPVEVDCPEAFLALAGEPVNEYSRLWRDRVRQHHAGRRAAKVSATEQRS